MTILGVGSILNPVLNKLDVTRKDVPEGSVMELSAE